MTEKTTFEKPPFVDSGQWIKAGFHCHTVNSDGGLAPVETTNLYRSKGYKCLGITDHRMVTPMSEFNEEGFVGIDSTENGGDPDIIGVGVTSAVPRDLPFSEKATMLADQGAFTIAAHPTYCAVTPEVYVNSARLNAMEIYNAYCDRAYTNGMATELWDMVLGQGKRIWGVASDDAHLNPKKRYYSDAGLGWLEVWTPALTEEAVLDALKRGAFYSTQGPRFELIECDDTTIRISCSSVTHVRWRTFGRAGFVDFANDGETLSGSCMPAWFRPNIYVRIELVDHSGRKAWSNPIFVQDGAG